MTKVCHYGVDVFLKGINPLNEAIPSTLGEAASGIVSKIFWEDKKNEKGFSILVIKFLLEIEVVVMKEKKEFKGLYRGLRIRE